MEEGVVSTDEDEDVGDAVDEGEATDNGMEDKEEGEYT